MLSYERVGLVVAFSLICLFLNVSGEEKKFKGLSFASPPPRPPFCLGSADPVHGHICAGPAVALTMAATLASEWLAPCVASAQALEALHCETEQQGELSLLGIWIALSLICPVLICSGIFCYTKHEHHVQVNEKVLVFNLTYL